MFQEKPVPEDPLLAPLFATTRSEGQRSHWVQLICPAADDAELPADPEFRAAFVASVEWGSRW
jgi:truncated hemoglobin YjbI